MLVLTRKSNQSIVIGDDIVVTVLEVRGDQIRLGISAPRDVAVHREEVWIARTGQQSIDVLRNRADNSGQGASERRHSAA